MARIERRLKCCGSALGSDLAKRLRNVTDLCVFGALPLLLVGAVLVLGPRGVRAYGIEFRGNLYDPAGRILEGKSPYELVRLERAFASGQVSRDGYIAQAVYPAPAHVAAVPFRLLSFSIAMPLFVTLSIAALIGALWLLGVRDWRCFGAAFLGVPVIHALNLGGLTPFLLFGAAAVWRYRDRRWAGAAAAGALIAVKLYLWPLLLWLAVTRRTRAAVRGGLIAAGLMFGGWAAIGFRGMLSYPHLLGVLTHGEERLGYSLVSVGSALGLGPGVSRLLMVAVGAALLAATWLAASSETGEQAAFALALVAAIALSPIVWQQYFILLLAPLALRYPQLGPGWLLAGAFWLAPLEGRTPRDLAVAWLLALATLAVAAGPWRARAGLRRLPAAGQALDLVAATSASRRSTATS